MQITLADGLPRHQEVLTCRTTVEVANRKFLTNFIILPNSRDNRTLLGIDFLEDAGIVINAPQRTCCFVDQPGVQRPFEPVPPATPSSAIRKRPQLESNKAQVAEVAMADTFYTPQEEEGKTEKEFIEEVFNKCFSHFLSTEIASINVALRPEETPAISEKQKQELSELLQEYRDPFDENGAPTTYAEHSISIDDNGTIAAPPYRLSPLQQTALKKELQAMLAEGIIEACESP
ncbi:hypothetical protein ANTPLA_LOCUS1956 [Anthophora plagiata]